MSDAIVENNGASAQPEPAQQPAPAESAPQQAGDVGTGDDVAASPEDSSRDVPLGALKAERQKRQELERMLLEERVRRETLERVLPAPKHIQPEPQETPDEFYNNPAQYVQGVVENARGQMRIELSEQLIRETKQDADEVLGAFAEMARHNPAVVAQMRNHPNPGKFAYDAGRVYMQTKDIGSPEELEKRLEQKLRNELEAEFRKKYAVSAASNTTPTNAGARGAGNTSAPVFQGHKPLEEIVRARR